MHFECLNLANRAGNCVTALNCFILSKKQLESQNKLVMNKNKISKAIGVNKTEFCEIKTSIAFALNLSGRIRRMKACK